MADEEITIAINAVDNTAKTLLSTTNSLLALGNAAATVDRVMSAYTNQQIRLENASERLENAQDRLEDAQRKLNKVMKDGSASLEDVEDAQREVERATRGLTISQNNLQRTQGQVIGTYINMGTQVVALIGSLPQLKKAIDAVRNSTIVATAFSHPWLLALGLTAAAATLYAVNHMDASEATTNFGNTLDTTNRKLLEERQLLTDVKNKINELVMTALPGESEAKKRLAEADLERIDAVERYHKASTRDELEASQQAIRNAEFKKQKILETEVARFNSQRDILAAEASNRELKEAKETDIIKIQFEERTHIIKTWSDEAIVNIGRVEEALKRISRFTLNGKNVSLVTDRGVGVSQGRTETPSTTIGAHPFLISNTLKMDSTVVAQSESNILKKKGNFLF